jgi:hypothetical protein
LVAAARREEISFMQNMPLYEKCTLAECWELSGCGPTSVKWVDRNKGTLLEPNYRSRLVARDFKPKRCSIAEHFAATPPLEAKRMLFRKAAQQQSMKIAFVDVKKAHTIPLVPPGVHAFISLPEEDDEPDKCGRLLHWLYGFRPAAQAWETFYSDRLVLFGFIKGVTCPTAFYHPVNGMRCVVHGDDFTFLGLRRDIDLVIADMKSWCELTVRAILGGEDGDDRDATILNRIVRWTGSGIEVEADPRHAEKLCAAFNLD